MSFARRWRYAVAILIAAAFGFSSCGDDIPPRMSDAGTCEVDGSC